MDYLGPQPRPFLIRLLYVITITVTLSTFFVVYLIISNKLFTFAGAVAGVVLPYCIMKISSLFP
jgi:hypothetical protein